MSPNRAFVESPLLNRSVGTLGTDFQVSEQEQPASPDGVTERIAPLHRHRTEDEAWYVLQGRLRFQYGKEEFEVTPGSGVLLPHGTPHTFWNPGREPTRYLLIARPKTVALLEALHRAGAARPVSMKELFSRFDVDLLD